MPQKLSTTQKVAMPTAARPGWPRRETCRSMRGRRPARSTTSTTRSARATHAAAPEEDKGWELPATTRWEERCGFGVFDREELQPEHAAMRAAATRAAATDDAAEHVPEQSSN